MNAGILKRKIDIEVESTTQNSYGEPTQSWSAFLSGIYASVEPLVGKEFFSSDIVNATVTHKIRIRYIAGVHPKMRVKYGTRIFDIVASLNYMEINKELTLMCNEVI